MSLASATADPTTRPVLTWSSGPREVLGYRFELTVPRELDFVRIFYDLLRDFPSAQDGDGVDRFEVRRDHDADGDEVTYGLHHGGRKIWYGRSGADFVPSWTWNLNRNVIATASTSMVVLHAACVARAGVTVVLPAQMESGKSTTTAGLLRDGFDYVTDEGAALDPVTGAVHPFPKPVTLDPGSWFLFPELAGTHTTRRESWQVRPRDLGARAGSAPVDPPRLVVFPSYQEGATTRVEPVRAGEAVLELCRSTFGFADRPRLCLDTLARTAERAHCFRLVIGDLDDAVTAVNELVSSVILENV